jgi:hypothetical protein
MRWERVCNVPRRRISRGLGSTINVLCLMSYRRSQSVQEEHWILDISSSSHHHGQTQKEQKCININRGTGSGWELQEPLHLKIKNYLVQDLQ